jgi:hypothetical protein
MQIVVNVNSDPIITPVRRGFVQLSSIMQMALWQRDCFTARGDINAQHVGGGYAMYLESLFLMPPWRLMNFKSSTPSAIILIIIYYNIL